MGYIKVDKKVKKKFGKILMKLQQFTGMLIMLDEFSKAETAGKMKYEKRL